MIGMAVREGARSGSASVGSAHHGADSRCYDDLVRTTVNIDVELLTEAKVVAALSHQSLGAVIDDALRSMLSARSERSGTRPRMSLQTDGGSGLQAGVDLEDKDSLAELLGENAVLRASG